MTEIEWLDADGRPLAALPPEAVPVPRAARTSRFDVRSPARWVEIGWVSTAVLAVVAPFLQLYRLRIEHANSQEVDGWGRFDSALNVAEGAGAHGIRFGVVTVTAAGLVVVAVVLRRSTWRRGAAARVASVSCTLGAGLLAATTALVFLDIDALFDSVRSELARFEGGSSVPSLHVGAGPWTMLAAAVVGLGTLLADAARRPHATSPRPVHGGLTAEPQPLGPADEAL